MTEALRIAVIVPVHNGADTIERCLRALARQTLPNEDYEVIVVDDDSDDDTRQQVLAVSEKVLATVKLVRQSPNAGPAAARNLGVAATLAPVLAFTDADCEVADDWLERAVARLEDDPSLAGVEGRTDPGDGEVSATTHQMRNPSGGMWMTCNMIYRREALEGAGGFDETFTMPWLEDSDVALSVQEDGKEIAFDEGVVVNHLVLERGRRRFFREARKRFFNPYLFRKHPELYREHISPVVPALPRLHLIYMLTVILPFIAWAVAFPGAAALLGLPWLFFLRRVAHAYKARDPLTILMAAVHPFVQTFWTIAGAIRFRAFSWDL